MLYGREIRGQEDQRQTKTERQAVKQRKTEREGGNKKKDS